MSFTQLAANAKNLGQQAYETLRDAIITLQLEPGQAIYENELADSLNISRTPVRDAVHLLISEQLVEVLPQRTKKIACISELKVKESGFVRLSLESSAFKLAARLWDSSDKRFVKAEKEIGDILQEQTDAAEEQDVAQFLRLDEAFHRYVLQLAGNGTLLEVVYHMRGHLNRFRFLAMKELVLTKGLVQEHYELFDALKKRDEAGVSRHLERHLGKLDAEIPPLREKFPDYFKD